MARPGVDYDDVAQVARQLLIKGENPSVTKIRNILGTGSNTTIGNHLNVWRNSFKKTDSPLLPESVPDDLMNPLDDFWTLALTKAEAKYQKYKEELEAKVTATETAETEALAQLEAKAAEMITLQQELSSTQEKLSETEKSLNILQGQYSIATTELSFTHSELERALNVSAEQLKSFDIERENQSRGHNEALAYERERASQTEKRLLNDVDQYRQSIKSLESEEEKHRKELQQLNESSHHSELALLQKQAELNGDNTRLNGECQQYHQEVKETKQQLDILQNQLTKSLETVEALQKVYEQSKNNEITLTENIGQLKETIVKLQATKTRAKP